MRHALVLFLFVALAVPTLAQERTHDITPETTPPSTRSRKSPCRRTASRSRTASPRGTRKPTTAGPDLWVVDTDGKGKPKQLTKDRANDRQPEVERRRQVDLRARQPQEGRREEAADRRQDAGVEGAARRRRAGGGHERRRRASPGSTTPRKPTRSSTRVDATATDEDDFSALRKKFDKPEYGSGKRTVSELFARDGGRQGDEEACRREAVHPRVRGHARRQADRDGHGIRRQVLKSEGEIARGRVGGRQGGDAADGRVPGEGRQPRTPGSKTSPGTRTAPASPSARSSTPTRRRSSSASSRTGKWATEQMPRNAAISRPRLWVATKWRLTRSFSLTSGDSDSAVGVAECDAARRDVALIGLAKPNDSVVVRRRLCATGSISEVRHRWRLSLALRISCPSYVNSVT